jgi:hypothetical protein
MKTWKILTLTIVLVSIGAPFVPAFANWLPRAVRALVVELAPPAAAALALVVYFDWRARLKSRMLSDARRDEEFATAT